jgi:hypothetical protein
VIEEFIRETEKENCHQKRLWVREWITKRESRGVSALLLKDLYLEDPKEFRLCLQLTPKKFESLLEMISPFIQKRNSFERCNTNTVETRNYAKLFSNREQLQNPPAHVPGLKTIKLKLHARKL